jgi:hypothetical protein
MWQIIVGRGAQRQMLQMLERDPVLIKKRFYEAISLNDDLERYDVHSHANSDWF